VVLVLWWLWCCRSRRKGVVFSGGGGGLARICRLGVVWMVVVSVSVGTTVVVDGLGVCS
jgi:hypothetical protein